MAHPTVDPIPTTPGDSYFGSTRRGGAGLIRPRTAEGKARSARNAIKHGLYGTRDPVIRNGVIAEDPDEFERMRAALTQSFDLRDGFGVLAADQLASVFWRMARVPRLETILMREDTLESRHADRHRERIECMLRVDAYLRAPDDQILDDNLYHDVAGEIDTAAKYEFGEEYSSDVDPPATLDGRVNAIDRLVRGRWASWEDAADAILAGVNSIPEIRGLDLEEYTCRFVSRLLHSEALPNLHRAEAHLWRERDRLVALLAPYTKAPPETD